MPVTAELRWSPQARADLLKLYVDIGLEQPLAAERYYDRIEAKANLLKIHPRMGVRRSDVRPSAHMLVETPFVIPYETVPDTDEGPVDAVEIVRVVNSRQDLPNLFNDPSVSLHPVMGNVNRCGAPSPRM